MTSANTDKAKPRRHPAEGGYARGEEKRLKIIETALRIFGEYGYERASTRQIALDAGVNPPALQYYFDGKAGLYLACVQHISEHFLQTIKKVVATADRIKPTDSPLVATDALCGIMDGLADMLLGSTRIESWSRFLARLQGEGDGPDYSIMKQTMKQTIYATLHGRCAALVGIATGLPAGEPITKLRSIAILGQLSAFHLGRNNALAVLGWSDFRGEQLKMLKGLLRTQTHAILRQNFIDTSA